MLLENWEVMKDWGEKPPQKSCVDMCVEVWSYLALVTEPELEMQAEEGNIDDSECLGSSGEDGDSSEEENE